MSCQPWTDPEIAEAAALWRRAWTDPTTWLLDWRNVYNVENAAQEPEYETADPVRS